MLNGKVVRRCISRFLALSTCMIAAVALAQPSKADFNSSASWFQSLDQQTRAAVQTALVLTADYGGLIDGDFGKGTFQALQTFQRSIGRAAADGVLSPADLSELQKQASQEIDLLGLEEQVDTTTQLRFLLATKLLVESSRSQTESFFGSADGKMHLSIWSKKDASQSFESIFGKAVVASSHRTIAYSQIDDVHFTVSGSSDRTFFYTRGIHANGRTVGFSLQYDPVYRTTGGILAVLMASLSSLPDSEGLGEPPPQARAPDKNPPPHVGGVSSGSGFFISGDGAVLTNFHVAGRCDSIEIPGYGSATLLKGDENVDLAVVKLDAAASTPWAKIRVTPVKLAESVVLAGYPLADLLNSSLNITTGVISSLDAVSDKPSWFTTNAGIQPGNSGGPILDDRGDVIGVAVAKIDDFKLLEQIGSVAPNVGFGIGSRDVLSFLRIFDHSEADGSEDRIAPQEVADNAKKFTVQVVCSQNPQAASSN